MVESVLSQNKTIYMHMQVHFRTQVDDPNTKDERFLELQRLGIQN